MTNTLHQELISCVVNSPRLSVKTKENYLSTLRDFLDYVRASEPLSQSARLWVVGLFDRGLAPRSIKTYVNNLKAVSRRWVTLGLGEDFALGLEYPRIVKTLSHKSKALTTDQVEAILNACSGKHLRQIRNRALFGLLTYTGLRRGSVVKIDTPDIDWDNRGLKVTLKGGDEFLVPLLPQVDEYLKPWYSRLKKIISRPDQSLFPSIPANAGPNVVGSRLKYSSLPGICEIVGRAVGFDFHMHQFRSTFITNATLAGWADWQIACVTGHKHHSDIIPETYKDMSILRMGLPDIL